MSNALNEQEPCGFIDREDHAPIPNAEPESRRDLPAELDDVTRSRGRVSLQRPQHAPTCYRVKVGHVAQGAIGQLNG